MAARRRAPNMTPEQERTFLQLVQLGAYQSEAAKKVGLSKSAISMRKQRDAAFREAVEAAEAGLEIGLAAHLAKWAPKDWRAALAMLERRFPERWAKPELRAQLAAVNVDTDALAKAINAGLRMLSERHAPMDEPDQEGDATIDPVTDAPPEAPSGGVTRS